MSRVGRGEELSQNEYMECRLYRLYGCLLYATVVVIAGFIALALTIVVPAPGCCC